MLSRNGCAPVLLPAEKFKQDKLAQPCGHDRYRPFVEACRGKGKTSRLGGGRFVAEGFRLQILWISTGWFLRHFGQKKWARVVPHWMGAVVTLLSPWPHLRQAFR